MKSLTVFVALGFGLAVACGGGGKSTGQGDVTEEVGPLDAVEQADPGQEGEVPLADVPQDETPADVAEQADLGTEAEPLLEVGPGDVVPQDVPGDGVQPGEQASETAQVTSVTITVREISMEQENPVAGVFVTLLSNDDGSPAGQTATTDPEGHVAFQLEVGARFGLKLTKAGDVDSYVFDLPAYEGSPQDVSIIPQAMVTALLGMLGANQSPDKGMLVGDVSWLTQGLGGGSIGCATVESTPAGQVFYFGPDGPATPEQMPSTGHDKSDFLVLNLPEGSVSLKASIGDTEVAAGTGLVFQGAITFRVQVSGSFAADPTSPGCNQ